MLRHRRAVRAVRHPAARLAELRQVVGAGATILLGFDRGGSYPVTFRASRDAGADWVTYRRAPLAPARPRRAGTAPPAGRQARRGAAPSPTRP